MNTQTSPTLAPHAQESGVRRFARLFCLLALICAAVIFATPTYASNGYKVYVTPVNDSVTHNFKVRIDGTRSFHVHVVNTPSDSDANGVTVYFYTNLSSSSVSPPSAVANSSGVTGFSLYGGWTPGTATVRAKVVAPNGTEYSDVAVVPIVKPDGENTAFIGFSGVLGVWKARLTPTDVNFGGLQVGERNGGVSRGQGDTCWYWGNPFGYAPFEAVTTPGPTNWFADSNNWWQSDSVGWGQQQVTDYRSTSPSRAPCRTSFNQYMDVIVPGSGNANDIYYTTNELAAGIQATTVSSGRDGQSQQRNWP